MDPKNQFQTSNQHPNGSQYNGQLPSIRGFSNMMNPIQSMNIFPMQYTQNFQNQQPITIQIPCQSQSMTLPSLTEKFSGQSTQQASTQNEEVVAYKPKKEKGRVYKCTKCDKNYLSYPALYTHTKLKHLQRGDTPSITNGRMRGRPRKNTVIGVFNT